MGERGSEKTELPEEEIKRDSGISKIVGAEGEKQEEIARFFRDDFENQAEVTEEMFKDVEREKTDQEKRTIGDILEKIPDFIKRYGGKPLDVSVDHIHFLDLENVPPENVQLMGLSPRQGGGYNWLEQTVFIVDQKNNLQNAQYVVHELMHFNSFQSIDVNLAREVMSQRRVGFEIGSKRKKETYFTDINEAITEELVKRFDRELLRNMEGLQKEVKEREYFKSDPNTLMPDEIAYILFKKTDEGKTMMSSHMYSYPKQREELQQIIKEIYDVTKDEEKFDSPERVFEIFAKAAMDGKLLRVANLYEKVYGEKSFRKLAEKTKKQ